MILKTPYGEIRRGANLTSTMQLIDEAGLGRYGSVSAGVAVNNATVEGIPAFDRAVSFAGEAVAGLSVGVYRRRAGITVPEEVTTTWQARFFSQRRPNPEQDWFLFWYILEASLTARRNAYLWKSKDADRVVYWTALHPDQVIAAKRVDGRVVYDVTFPAWAPRPPEVGADVAKVAVGPSTLLHIRGRGGTGELVALSPVTQFATALGSTIAKYRAEAAGHKNGKGGLVISFPEGTNRENAQKWRELFDQQHSGPDQSGTTKVVGGGASVTEIGMTRVDQQFAELLGLSVLDVSRITAVPEWFLSVEARTTNATTPEHEMQRWKVHGLSNRCARIASAINADADMFPTTTDSRFMFDTTAYVVPDLEVADNIAHQQIQDGRLLVDEWRESRGLEPLPNDWGKVPQVTPVGGAPSPIAGDAPDTLPEDSDEDDQEA